MCCSTYDSWLSTEPEFHPRPSRISTCPECRTEQVIAENDDIKTEACAGQGYDGCDRRVCEDCPKCDQCGEGVCRKCLRTDAGKTFCAGCFQIHIEEIVGETFPPRRHEGIRMESDVAEVSDPVSIGAQVLKPLVAALAALKPKAVRQ